MKKNPRGEQEFEIVEIAPTDGERDTIALELHHRHLPHLADAGFIEWDRRSGTVIKGENFHKIRPLLELMDDHRDELPDGWP